MTSFQRDLALRISAAVLLGAAALALFLLDRDPSAPGPENPPGSRALVARHLDEGIDSVLAGFHIDTATVRKRDVALSEDGIARTERRVSVPPDVVPVMVNAALNDMARRFNARAVASENARYRTVTIHLEFAGVVYHTVIIRVDPRLKPPPSPAVPRSI